VRGLTARDLPHAAPHHAVGSLNRE
jgi:hypothetical protein